MSRTWMLRSALAAVGLPLAVFLVVASGVIPIEASSGHWAATHWLLDFAKRRSVSLHSIRLSPPPELPDDSVRSAAYYDFGCRPCHGDPIQPQTRIASKSTPAAPYLPDAVSRWDRNELFYIVKHGIKFTGMPAWPALSRDDEVWVLTTFLARLPTMSPADYLRLARGVNREQSSEPEITGLVPSFDSAPQAIRENCARCHGMDGVGRDTGIPILAGQSREYLYNALKSYAREQRNSGMMEPIAWALDDKTMQDTAAYYSAQSGLAAAGIVDVPQSLKAGQEIATTGIPAQRVPACKQCHEPAAIPKHPAYPLLSGQRSSYLVQQLKLFGEGQRGGSAFAHLMSEVAPYLTAQQMQAVAAYYRWQGDSPP